MLWSVTSFSILFILRLFLGIGLSYMPFFSRCSLLWWIWAPCCSWNEHRALRGLSKTWTHRWRMESDEYYKKKKHLFSNDTFTSLLWFHTSHPLCVNLNVIIQSVGQKAWQMRSHDHNYFTSWMSSFLSRMDRATAAHSSVDRQMLEGCVRITYWLDRVLLSCTWLTKTEVINEEV